VPASPSCGPSEPNSRLARRDPLAAGGSAAPTAGGGALCAPGAWTIAICLGWAVLAIRSPDVTYHLAPFAAASAWPVASRLALGRAIRRETALAIVASALSLTLVTVLVLAAAGRLGGPSVWHGSGALETVVLALLGAAWAWRVATRDRPGLIGRLR